MFCLLNAQSKLLRARKSWCRALSACASSTEAAAAYQHEFALGVEHAGAHGFVPVVKDDDVESDGLWHGEEERQHPNGHDLHHCQHGDSHPLNSAPGGHSSVPTRRNTQKHSETRRNTQKHAETLSGNDGIGPGDTFSLHGSTPNTTNSFVCKANQNVKN